MSNIPVSSCDNGSFVTCTSRPWKWLCAASLLAFCVGCWEEVHYEPTQASRPSTQTQAIPQQQEPTVDTAPSEEKVSDPLADNLIATDDPPPQTPTSPVSEPPLKEETTIEPEESAATSPEVNAKQEPEKQPAVVDDTLDTEDDLAWLDPPTENKTPSEATPDEVIEENPEPTTVEPMQTDTARNAIAVWQMSSKWSLAAAYFAKGLGADRYGDTLAQANYAAKLLGISLPDFSEFSEEANRQATIARFLIKEAGPRLVEDVAENDSEHHAALAEFAIKTHALLLVYTPLNEELEKIVTAIRTSAENSALPAEIWQPIVELLEQRSTFKEVKQAVFQLHEQTANHLSRLGSP